MSPATDCRLQGHFTVTTIQGIPHCMNINVYCASLLNITAPSQTEEANKVRSHTKLLSISC